MSVLVLVVLAQLLPPALPPGLHVRGLSATDRLARGACLGQRDLVVQSLAENAKPDVSADITDVQGAPLFLVAACPDTEADDATRADIAKLLVAAGAQVTRPGVIKYARGGVPMAPHIAAAYMRRPKLLAYLLSAGASIDEGDYARDGSALLWAAEQGCAECVSVLAGRGAALERRNSMGLTALFVAAARGDGVMVDKLLAAGANPFVKESMGKSAVDAAKNEAIRKDLRAAQRRVIATWAAWVVAVLALALAVYIQLRRREEGPS